MRETQNAQKIFLHGVATDGAYLDSARDRPLNFVRGNEFPLPPIIISPFDAPLLNRFFFQPDYRRFFSPIPFTRSNYDMWHAKLRISVAV